MGTVKISVTIPGGKDKECWLVEHIEMYVKVGKLLCDRMLDKPGI